jgi:hypothetical protein
MSNAVAGNDFLAPESLISEMHFRENGMNTYQTGVSSCILR